MKNVLVIGLTVPQTIADPDGSNPATHLGGAAPAMAKSLMNGGHLRTTLLTVLQRDDLGKATIRMLEQSGLLYRAIDCDIPTVHKVIRRRPDSEPHHDPADVPSLTKKIMNTAISQTAADYDYVVADCNVDTDILFDLGRISQKLIIHGNDDMRSIRIMASNPWPKAAVVINRRAAAALMEFSEAKAERNLKDVLVTDQLLVTKDNEGWTLYNHKGESHSPPTYATDHHNYEGASAAAAAALVQAISRNLADPTNEINTAIADHLKVNPS